MLKAIMENQPIGIIRLSELLNFPQHNVRYSHRILAQEALIKQAEAREDDQDVHGAAGGSGQHQSRCDQADREAQKREDSLHAKHDSGPPSHELSKGCEATRCDSLMDNPCAHGLALKALREIPRWNLGMRIYLSPSPVWPRGPS